MTRMILLVDDDGTQLKLNRVRLEAAGYEVKTAACAAEAMAAARGRRPDLVVSDVIMDETDGFTLCRMLRRDPVLAAVPVVLVSAQFGGAEDRQLAYAVDAQDLVERSPDFSAELAAVRAILQDGPRTQPIPVVERSVDDLYHDRVAHQMSRLQQQRQASDARYRALMENARDAISLVTPDGIILECNEALTAIMGYTREETVGRSIRDFAAPGHEDANDQRYRRNVAEGGTSAPVYPLLRKDGTVAWMEWSNAPVDLDGETVIVSIGRDTTADVEAARALEASEAKYRSLIDNIPDVVWSATLDSQTTFLSSKVESILGYTAEEVTSTPDFWMDSIHPDDKLLVESNFASVREKGVAYDHQYRIRHRDGSWRWVRSHATRTTQADGSVTVDGILSDITQLKRLEDQMRQVQKLEAVGQLTGGVAHDFNNILAAIIAYASFLTTDLAEHDPRRDDAQQILDSARRGASLTRQLLAFSRKQVLEPTVIDPNGLVVGVEKMLRRLIGEDVDLVVNGAPDLGRVRADAGQLEQVIMNLVVNSRDAMPTGGRLTIETANVELGTGHSSADGLAAPGLYVMIAVSDTGCGMDEATRARIFEPFFTPKEVGRGTGLGLSTCYGIVKQSGGFIYAYSEPGQGTTMKVYLPRVDAESATPAARRGGAQELRGTETVLLIEDDARLRKAVARMLGEFGYTVVTARDGVDALEVAQGLTRPVQLLLSDVIMPGMTGPEAVVQLEGTLGAPKALFMSGYTDHAVLRNGALQEGLNFIQKPFAPEALARKVREVLDHS